VVTAARLADRARPREILLSSDVCDSARESRALRTGPRKRIRLKGFSRAVAVAALHWQGDDDDFALDRLRHLHLPVRVERNSGTPSRRAGMLAPRRERTAGGNGDGAGSDHGAAAATT